MAGYFVFPINTALDTVGESIAGAQLTFFQANSSTPQAVYSDQALSTPITQPVTADGSGRFERMYMLNAAYKVTFSDANAVPIWTLDDVTGVEVLTDPWVASKYIKRNAGNTGWDFLSSSQVWDDVKEVATTSNAGIAEIATQAEVDTGTSTDTIVTPATLRQTTATSLIAPRGYIDGLTLSNGSDANHDINIAAGACRASDNTVTMSLASTFTKQDDAKWAVGTNAGGMPDHVTKTGVYTTSGTAVTGIITSFNTEFQVGDILWSTINGEGRVITTISDAFNMVIKSAFSSDVVVPEAPKINGLAKDAWYHVYAISKTDGTTDGGFDTRSPTATSLLLADAAVVSGSYTKRRIIGSFLTDSSSNILSFVQIGDDFIWGTEVTEFSSGTPSSGSLVVTTPPHVKCKAFFDLQARMGDPGVTSSVVTVSVGYPGSPNNLVALQSGENFVGQSFAASVDHNFGEVWTNTSSTVDYAYTETGTTPTTTATIVLSGYTDLRGKDA